MKVSIVTLFLTILLLGCASKNEIVLFSSSRSGNSDIFTMTADGKNLIQYTDSDHEEWSPVWISQREISFLRQNEDQITIHRLNIDSREEVQIPHPTTCVLDDKNMLYSATGDGLLYACQEDIYLYNSTTNDLLNLTENLEGVSRYPSWSFDERSVLFTNNQSGDNDVYQLDLASGTVTQLTQFDSNDERGELSPNNTLLVFSSNHFNSNNQDLILLDLSSGSTKNITNSEGTELIARFSRSGKDIYFGSNKDGNWELYRYEIAQNKTHRLTTNEAFDGDPRILKF